MRNNFKHLSIVCFAGLAAGMAHAGFVDERKPAARPVAAAASSPTIVKPGVQETPYEPSYLGGESFQNPKWDEAAPTLEAPVSLVSGIAKLIPVDFPSVQLQPASGVDMQAQTSWPSGLSRKAAMLHVAKTLGLLITFDNRIVWVDPIKVSPVGFDYGVTTADVNFRKALKRWAAVAGWTFSDEHWKLPADLPIVGTDSLGGDFKTAVRALISSSELTSVPGRPCFYSNQVLRVLPKTSQCDRIKD